VFNLQQRAQESKTKSAHRPNNLTINQSVATKVRFRNEKRVLKYALLQKRYVATPPVAIYRNQSQISSPFFDFF